MKICEVGLLDEICMEISETLISSCCFFWILRCMHAQQFLPVLPRVGIFPHVVFCSGRSTFEVLELPEGCHCLCD